MRNHLLRLIAAAAILPASLIASSPLGATPIAPLAAAARPAVDESPPVAKVICYGFGWRGWGIYPGWFRPACTGAYVVPGYVAAPVYPPAYAGPAYPPGRCWVPPSPEGRPGYWAAC